MHIRFNIKKKEDWKPALILVGIILVAYLNSFCLPRLIWTWLEILFTTVLIACKFLLPSPAKNEETENEEESAEGTHKKPPVTLNSLIMIALFLLVNDARHYYFFDGKPILFWIVSLNLGIAFGVAITVKQYKNSPNIKSFILSLIGACVIATALSHTAVLHMNYVLDFNESTEYVAVIEDKSVTHRSKGGTVHYLHLTANEKPVKIQVSSDTYDRYEVGDEYFLEKHQGAFGGAFYLP